MSAIALLRGDFTAAPVEATQAALEMKADALAKSGIIGQVRNASEQEQAVAAQLSIKQILKLAEESRVKFKEPVLDRGRQIDDVFKKFKAELDAELMRLAMIIGDFQTLELARVRAEEAARNAELAQIERDRQAALSQATTHQEMEKVQETYNAIAVDVPKPEPVRAKGQMVSEEWAVEVTDVWALARAHPGCVKIEPRLSEIKQLLNLGVKLAGVRASKVVKAGVRVSRAPQALEVVA